MPKLMLWVCSTLLAIAMVVPVVAGAKDGTETKTPESTNSAAQPAAANANVNPAGQVNVTALLGVLVMKGVLAPAEAKSIEAAAPGTEFQALVEVLTRKGVVSAADLAPVNSAPATPATTAAAPVTPQPEATASAGPAPAATRTVTVAMTSPQPAAEPAAQAKMDAPPPPPAVVPAIAPLRVLPVDPPKKDALNAAFKMGAVKMTPYGFIKATGVYDSSDPNGDDFPFVGLFLTQPSIYGTTTGPTKDPEFHLKARSTRIGANFEWPDISPKLTFTGRIEGDYEGNFSEVDNRDVSSIRSNSFQLRLAWARMDYAASDKTDFYFEAGQDWTLFGSSALPSILETTFLGAFYGDIYERSPQFQFGLVRGLGGDRDFKISPTFAIMMPSTGQILKLGSVGLAGQLGEGEREGADSGRPEVEGRLAVQWKLDKAPAVAPAQIFVTGFESKRTSIVPNSAPGYATMPANYLAAFPNGFTASSNMYGLQGGIALPTRWFTVVATAYRGGDLRFFFGGQVNSYATDTTGLTNIQGPFTTLDGGCLTAAGCAVLGTNAAGNVVVAPQRPIRSFGGFVNLGLPLSRWFNANPKGHNAGWQIYLHMGKDQVDDHDLNYPGYTANANIASPLPLSMGKLFAGTLYYKVNPYVTFAFEQSVYATRLKDGITGYIIAGTPSNEWQDHRSEFGPIFNF